MLPFEVPLSQATSPCNQCGECCKRGGECGLRHPSWSGRALPYSFQGTCEMLTEDNRCGVMLRVVEYWGDDHQLREWFGLRGLCTFPSLKVELPVVEVR